MINNYDVDYDNAINALKEKYPAFKDVNFDITNGVLGYTSGIWCLAKEIDIHELQKFVNEYLGQKVYRIEYTAYVELYARDENEAREFAKNERPKPYISKITETNLK